MRQPGAERMTRTNMTNAEADQAADRAEQGAPGAPEKAPSNKGASQRKGAPNSQNAAKGGKTKAARPNKKAKSGRKAAKTAQAKQARTPRADSKRAKVLAMIRRANGASLSEIMKATDWQAHTVRGFISIATHKHRLHIQSSRNESGQRVYRMVK